MNRHSILTSCLVALALSACGTDLGEDASVATDLDALTVGLPGRIQAEDYDKGKEGVAYHDTTKGNTGGVYRTDGVDLQATTDTGGGYNVGWIVAGEWLKYTVNAPRAATYTFVARVASGQAGTKTIHLTIDGAAKPAVSFTDASGWQSWTNVTLGSFALSAGTHSVRFTADTAGCNFNFIEVTTAPPPCVPTTCLAASASCGSIPDGCGGTLDCGVCSAGVLFGACPARSAGISSVITKFGPNAAIRAFVAGGFVSAVARPADASVVHYSWKPALGSTLTDAMLITAFANLRDGDIVEVWHEADVKYRKGSDLAPMLALKNQLHARVVALRSAGKIKHVLTANTLAGWSFDSTSSVNASNLHADADLVGIDMDGIVTTSDAYYPFAQRQMAELAAFYRAGGYTGWVVAEFSTPLYQQTDPTAAKRIAWFRDQMTRITPGLPSAGVPPPTYIAWFDFDNLEPDEGLTLSNEIATWREHVTATLP